MRRLHALASRLGDLSLDPLLVSSDVLGAEHALVQQLVLEALEAVVLRELVDLLLGAIAALVVLGRVGTKAVDEAFDERRAVAGPRARDRFFGEEVPGDRISSVDRYAGKSVSGCALSDVLDPIFLVERRGDREAVVLSVKDLSHLSEP